MRTFVVSQGPQILVKAHGRPPDDFFADPPRIQLEMRNQGPTTARGVRYEFWIEVLPWEFVDFTPAANYHKTEHSISVYPSQQPVIMNIPLGRVISSAERQAVKDLERKVCVRIRVEYRDIFSSDTQVANFGYWMQDDGLGFLPKYNDGDTRQQPN